MNQKNNLIKNLLILKKKSIMLLNLSLEPMEPQSQRKLLKINRHLIRKKKKKKKRKMEVLKMRMEKKKRKKKKKKNKEMMTNEKTYVIDKSINIRIISE